MLSAQSDILYVRASLRPLAARIKESGGILPFLREHVNFTELFVPHFYGARPFWRKPLDKTQARRSGALGKRIASLPDAAVSRHPANSFVGIGERVSLILAEHDATMPCFYPVGELARRYDFSMLLLGCLDESPGFSTVHVAQQELGLTQRHLIRHFLRWDGDVSKGEPASWCAAESPGCSISFDKFYKYYEEDDNLVRGDWFGVAWIFIPSARRALETERMLLSENGRFVDCGRIMCTTCRFRLY